MKKILLFLTLFVCGISVSQTFDNMSTGSGYYINKIIPSPSGDDMTREYYEFRGTPNAIIPSNLYFVSVEGDGEGTKTNMGKVDEAMQLGDGTRTFGSNGLLVVVANYTDADDGTITNNLYAPIISSGTTVLTTMITGAIGSDISGNSSSDFGSANPDIGWDGNFADPSATYMLITANSNPDGVDFDDDNDGIIDAAGDHIDDNWVLYDSVSYLDDDDFASTSDQGEFGYGQIVFAQKYSTDGTGGGIALNNASEFRITTSATIINHDSTSDVSYLFRQGTKTGYTTNDWVGAANGSTSYPDWNITGTNSKINRTYFKGFQFNTDIFYGQINPTEPNAWNGATTDWATATNWDLGIIPGIGEVVTIGATSNNPNISETTGAITENITIDTAASLTINSGGSLIVNGTATGNVTYKRTITKDAGPTNAWYAVSIPVSGTTVTSLLTENNFAIGSIPTRIGLATYNNDGSNWNYYTNTSTDVIATGTGLIAKLDNTTGANDLSFTGTYTNTVVEPAISQNGSNFFNFIGNPFTSYVNLGQFFTDNNATNRLSEQTIWIWDENKNGTNQGGYVQKMAGTDAAFEIAPTQGFFVSAGTANSNKVTFNLENQSHQSNTFLKSSSNTSEITLKIAQEDQIKSTKIYYLENATTDFDNGFDGSMFDGLNYDLAIYSELVSSNTGKKIGIQSLPKNELESLNIPIGIKAFANKEISISASSINLPENVDVFLEDKTTNTITNLNETDYTVTVNNDIDGSGRFFIRTTTSQALSVANETLSSINIYKKDKQTLVISGLLEEGQIKVSIYNLLGKQVLKTSTINNYSSEIKLPNLTSGVYIVKVVSEKGNVQKKIIL
ncbi:T9SS type A sorting domain-containing protein [uncultured Polaribacter sp.]|uniref:T9SS type A sorting domain-containing protein n=1 Tax=uncultured Polaribacter sp. TaxID=174711 RepID=UPI0026257172|nr:T9SS type A sorting domain-containing protein [uncultured Polaribacter sp.]